MSSEPEALRLADSLKSNTSIVGADRIEAELRRLHLRVYELEELLKNRDETSTYRIWCAMRERCGNRGHKSFRRYGGRGISVCERWQDYHNFLSDMGICPKGKSLDRIDVNGNYEPNNCRWATQSEQQRNTRRNRLYTYQGKTQCLTDWAAELGIHKNTIRSRIDDAGMTFEQAVAKPRQARRNSLSQGGEA